MTTHNKHIHYDYYNTLAIRASPTKFQFSGKPNEPNVVFTNGTTTTQYVSKEASIVGSTLIIENEPITNYGKNLFLHFPLVSDPSVSYNAIDQMLGSKVGESLEIWLEPILGRDTNCIYKADNIAVFQTPIRIQSPLSLVSTESHTIREGAKCNDTNKLKAEIDRLSKLIGAMRADTDSLLTIHKEGFEGAANASRKPPILPEDKLPIFRASPTKSATRRSKMLSRMHLPVQVELEVPRSNARPWTIKGSNKKANIWRFLWTPIRLPLFFPLVWLICCLLYFYQVLVDII